MVGKLNSRVIIKTLTKTKDSGGGVSYAAVTDYEAWAYVENKTGQANFFEGQRQDNYDYRITIRQYDSKIITTKNTLEYKGKEFKINSISTLNEGGKSFLVLRCTYHGN